MRQRVGVWSGMGTLGLWLGGALVAAGCGAEPVEDAAGAEPLTATESALRARAPAWEPLGGDLNPFPGQQMLPPSLLTEGVADPLLAFSVTDPDTLLTQSRVLRWTDGDWSLQGDPMDGKGPAIAVDGHGRLHACVVPYGSGPVVARWDGLAWVPLGADISVATGYRKTRMSVDLCGGLQFERPRVPVVAWSADEGAKVNSAYVARWNPEAGQWTGLGEGRVGDRASGVSIAVDRHHRLFLATHKPGGSYGGAATTRVWRWDQTQWLQLGADMLENEHAVVVARRDDVYLALHDNASQAITVQRLRDEAWSSVPSPGAGTMPELAFTGSGTLVVAYLDTGTPRALRVAYLTRGRWQEAGPPVAVLEGEQQVRSLALGLDARDRPIVAWTRYEPFAQTEALFVERLSRSLASCRD